MRLRNHLLLTGLSLSLVGGLTLERAIAQSQDPTDVNLPTNHIKLYEHSHFRGEAVTFDLSQNGRNAWYVIDRSRLHDRASAIVANPGKGYKILCAEHNPSKGGPGRVIEIKGTGEPVFIDDLGSSPWNINDKITAIKVIKTD